MKPETFKCPHCGAQLEKSAAAWVMGEANVSTDASGVPSNVPCPACGGSISTDAMVKGKYDDKPDVWGPIFLLLGIALSFGASIVAESRYGKHIGFWKSVGIGFGLSVIVVLLLIGIWELLKTIAGTFRK